MPLLTLAACGGTPSEDGPDASARRDKATVDYDESYVVVGLRSVRIGSNVRIHSGNVGVSYGLDAYPLPNDPCLGVTPAGGVDLANCYVGSGDEALQVLTGFQSDGPTSLFSDTVQLAANLAVDELYYRERLQAPRTAVVGERHIVGDEFFPLFPSLPTPPTPVPGTDAQGGTGTTVVLRDTTRCLGAGVHGSFTVRQGATLRFAADCANPGNTSPVQVELRDVTLQLGARLEVQGTLTMRDLTTARDSVVVLGTGANHLRDVSLGRAGVLGLGAGALHVRNLRSASEVAIQLTTADSRLDILVANQVSLASQTSLNATAFGSTDPSSVDASLVRMFVRGRDGTGVDAATTGFPAKPRAVLVGGNSKIHANIMALGSAPGLGGTIELGSSVVGIGSYFADHVIIGGSVQLTNRNSLVGEGSADPDYRDGDADNDGRPDADDNCLTTPNAGQGDVDGDGFGDVCDNCPAVANPRQEVANPTDPEAPVGAACAEPPQSYCGDGVVDTAHGEECDDGFPNHGAEQPCDTECFSNLPRIVSQPANITVLEGGTAAFHVSASGPNVGYLWVRDGVQLPEETSSTLTLTNVTLADSGTRVYVIVWNAAGGLASAEATLTVTSALPVITQQPVPRSVVENTSASFSVTATGSGLSYQWQRDGVDIEGATGPTYAFAASLADDGASLRVRVGNATGSVTSTSALLTVTHAPPVLTAQPSDQAVDEGQSAHFSVSATGSSLSYAWFRDGVPIPGANEAAYATPPTVVADHGAQFHAVVSNPAGSVTSDAASLAVTQLPPVIVVQPQDQTVQEGGTPSFEVNATGSALGYQWRRDGVPLPGATAPTLSLPEVTLADNGAVFDVVVANAAGSVTSAGATLHINPNAPVIITHPEHATVEEGGSATFGVFAAGAGLSYQWQRDGVAIPGATSPTFSISNATLADSGATFRAVVTNVSGSVTSQPATLTVQQLPPTITSHPVSLGVVQGSSAVFGVTASGTGLSYQWQRNGADIGGATSASYTLANVALADHGDTFRVVVTNTAGSVTSSAASLSVTPLPPVIVSQPADTTVLEGSAATFEVTASGANLGYQWQRDGTDLPGATAASLVLPAVSWADRGSIYRVRVTNSAGTVVSGGATLSVTLAPPTIVSHPASVAAYEGEGAWFTVTAAGSELTYQWQRDGVDLPGETDSALSLAEVAFADNGSAYRVVVSNAAGTVTSTAAALTVVLALPVIVTHPAAVTGQERGEANFSVAATGTLLSYQWLRNGVALSGENGPTLVLTDLVLAQSGSQFSCEVSNASGSVVSTPAVLTVSLAPPVISVHPEATSVAEGADATFSVTALGSNLSYQWQRDGAPIPGATTPSYTLTGTSFSDHGAELRVVVSNAAGSVTSLVAALSVVLAPPVIAAHPANQVGPEQGSVTFSVSATGSQLAFQWERDGALVPGATTASLVVADLQVADSGASFRLRVSNSAGTVWSNPATLTVAANAPVFTLQPANQTVVQGQTATFTAAASGTGVSYQWQRNGVGIPSATSAAYSFTAALSDHGALYAVVATNTAGSVSSSAATLSVTHAAPVITSQPQPVSVQEGGQASFSVTATGSDLTYQWRRDGAVIPGATTAAYQVSATLADEGALFSVTVTNPGGSVASSAAALTVSLAPPAIVTGPSHQTVVEGQPASFTCAVQGSNTTLTWTRNGIVVPGATGLTYTTEPTTLADHGAVVTCTVTNAAGFDTSAEATLTVLLAAPTLVEHPESLTVDEGDSATFAVVATGSQLTYQWQRDGIDIPGAVTASHTVLSAAFADSGSAFSVRVANAAGTVQSLAATLTVTLAPPVITASPESVSVREGQTATFSVTASGSALSYAWLRDGVVVPGANTPSLSIPDVTLADSESVVVARVSNAAGTVSSEAATLTVVQNPPVILAQPGAVTAEEGGSALLSVTASGTALAYQWRKNGAPLAGEISATLALSAIPFSDDGAVFDVVVTNAAGSVTSEPAVLTVNLAPPTISAPPVDQSAVEGNTASFSVSATGSLLSFQWLRDGTPISGATGATYSIAAVTLADQGASFSVRVTNAAGTVTSAAATLSVALAPPTITAPPLSQTVAEGAEVRFGVDVVGSLLSFQWYRGAAPISGATGAELVFNATHADDGATYRVRVSNAAGTVDSAAATLTVQLALPTVTQQPASLSVLEGASATFTVEASGSLLTYQWLRAGLELPGETSATLSVAEAQLSDSGAVFACRVTNPAGSVVSQPATLTVQLAPPTLVSGPSGVTVLEGQDATFTVSASGSLLAYRWLRNGTEIPGETSPTLTLAAVAFAEHGAQIVARVSNAAGSTDSPAATLSVTLRAPTVSAHPADQVVAEGGTATFTASITGSNVSLQWQREGVDIEGATLASLTLSNVQLGDSGARFRLVATNAAGSVTTQAALLTVDANAPTIQTQPASITVPEEGDAAFSVAATGSGLTYQWQRNGVDLPGATSPTYTLTSAQFSDTGAVFQVVVSNVAGSVTSATATLTVTLLAPTVVTPPQDVAATERGSATFTASLRGTLLSLQWLRNGQPVSGATSASLTLTDLDLTDDGAVFALRGTNAAGTVTTPSATLTVALAPPEVTAHPEATSTTERGSAQFSAAAIGTGLTYQWERNGVPVPSATQAALALTNVPLTDDGARYRLAVTNPAGTVRTNEATLSVALAPPLLDVHPESQSVDEGETVTFTVQVTGSQVDYQWRRDGVAIPGAVTSALTLPAVTLADSGATFDVVVQNSAGALASTAATLTVTQLPPVILTAPLPATVDEGQSAHFSVAFSGSNVSVSWLRDDVVIPDQTGNTLQLDNLALTDSGSSIRVRVTNAAGMAISAPVSLTVRQLAPVITTHPQHQDVVEGAPASFSVAASGSLLTYQWQRNGVAIEGATSATFTLPSAAYADNGAVFAVAVINAAGAVLSNNATLSVQLLPPSITTQPESQSVTEGQAAAFSVVASGTSLTYQWEKDGAALPSATSASFGIASASITDAGAYRVRVSNEAGSVLSAQVTLAVTLAAPVITTQPQSLSVAEGSPALFTGAASGTSVTYQWLRDGSAISGATSASYTLTAAMLADSGSTFQLRARNSGGDVFSDTATLTVTHGPPVISTQPESVAVQEGQGFSLSVTASGSNLGYQWQKAGTPIPGATSATFTVASATLGDGGEYRCTVSNPGGQTSSSPATVTVNLNPPVITQHPQSASANVGQSASFTVAATGDQLTYQWLRHGAPISGATSPTLTVNATYTLNGSAYTAVVSNSGGTVTSTAATLSVVDLVAPSLSVDGPATRATYDAFATLTGTAADEGVGLSGVSVTNDRASGNTYGGTVSVGGAFTVEVPLQVGANVLTVRATDAAGNSATQQVTVTHELPLLPLVTITTPAPNTVTTAATITVSGTVRSTLAPEAIRLELGNQVEFPEGTGGEYAYTFTNVPLQQGGNVLTVRAISTYGATQGQVVVTRGTTGGGTGGTGTGPVIELAAAAPNVYYTSDTFHVAGTVRTTSCVAGVTVNGQAAQVTLLGSEATFERQLSFSDHGSTTVAVTIIATDCSGAWSTASFTAHRDDQPPTLMVAGVDPVPASNGVLSNPFTLSGRVRDNNLAGISVSGLAVGLLPTGVPGEWEFTASVALQRAQERVISVEAWDSSGNRVRREYVLRLDAAIEIEILSPLDEGTVILAGETGSVSLRARVLGLGSTDRVSAQLDGEETVDLSYSAGYATGTLASVSVGEHAVVVTASTSGGQAVAVASSSFTALNSETLPLRVTRMEPANGASLVEANQAITVHFNKPIDPELLEVQVRETVHGRVYAPLPDVVDLTNQSDVRMVAINRNLTPVPGNSQNLPGNAMVAFYPSQDYGYGGRVQVDVLYDGESISHTDFNVRPTPTLISGFVSDDNVEPLAGVVVSIPALGYESETDEDGNYGFGWGWPASRQIPGGIHRVVVNPGGRNPRYGTTTFALHVTAGALTNAPMTRVLTLDPRQGYRGIAGGMLIRGLARGDLDLDLRNAAVRMPDGSSQGGVLTQVVAGDALPIRAAVNAHFTWAYATHPTGVQTTGPVALTMRLPQIDGSRDYMAALPALALVLAFDPVALQLTVVGVARVNTTAGTMTCDIDGGTLDWLAVAWVPAELLPSLQAYLDGDLSLPALRAVVGTTP